MLWGVGVDIVSVERFSASYARWGEKLLDRLFHADERSIPLGHERWAGRFAAKEAVMKALGRGWGSLSWHDIRISHRKSGQPRVQLHGRAGEWGRKMGVSHIHMSLSHEKEHAVAVAVVLRDPERGEGAPCS